MGKNKIEMYMKTKGVCVVTTRIGSAGFIPLLNLTKILSILNLRLTVISSEEFKDFIVRLPYCSTSENFNVVSIGRKRRRFNLIIDILNHIILQFIVCLKLVVNKDLYDLIIFFIGGEKMLIPIIFSKFALKKRIVLLLAGSDEYVEAIRRPFVGKILRLVSNINRNVSDKILIYTPNLVREWNMYRYIYKIIFVSEHNIVFPDEQYKTKQRECITFIGRLSIEKGIDLFLNSVKLIEERCPNFKYKFLIAGDGELKETVEQFSKRLIKLEYLGWVNRKELLKLLSRSRLIVLPSYTEGLPNVILEALSMRTPVLVTPVGSIPDIISDKKTGFILYNPEPREIADIIELLSYRPAELRRVGYNGYILIKKKFNTETVVERWKNVLNLLVGV